MREDEENLQEDLEEPKAELPQSQVQYKKRLGLKLRKSISAGTKPQPGQAFVEYALLIALIAVVAIGILVLLGPTVSSVFTSITGTVAGNCGDTAFTPGQATPTPASCNINCYQSLANALGSNVGLMDINIASGPNGSTKTPTPVPPTATPTPTPTNTPTPTPVPPTATNTPTNAPTATNTPTPTTTTSGGPTATSTPTFAPTNTPGSGIC